MNIEPKWKWWNLSQPFIPKVQKWPPVDPTFRLARQLATSSPHESPRREPRLRRWPRSQRSASKDPVRTPGPPETPMFVPFKFASWLWNEFENRNGPNRNWHYQQPLDICCFSSWDVSKQTSAKINDLWNPFIHTSPAPKQVQCLDKSAANRLDCRDFA